MHMAIMSFEEHEQMHELTQTRVACMRTCFSAPSISR